MSIQVLANCANAWIQARFIAPMTFTSNTVVNAVRNGKPKSKRKKKSVAGRINAFRFCVSSLNADARSARTHSACLSTKLLAPDFPCLLAVHYIPRFIHDQTYMNEKLQNPLGTDLWTPSSESYTQVFNIGGEEILEWLAEQVPLQREEPCRAREDCSSFLYAYSAGL